MENLDYTVHGNETWDASQDRIIWSARSFLGVSTISLQIIRRAETAECKIGVAK